MYPFLWDASNILGYRLLNTGLLWGGQGSGSGVWIWGFTLQGRCSTTWGTPPALFALVILELGSCFLFRPWSSYCRVSAVTGMTGMHHHAQLLPLRWGLANCPELLGTVILPILASCVAWGDRGTPLHPAIGWDGGLTNSNHDPPK
jgi:hypothetical protein